MPPANNIETVGTCLDVVIYMTY